MNLVKTFSKMLDSIPHDQAFTQLIINQVLAYYEKCCDWFKGWYINLSNKIRLLTSEISSHDTDVEPAPRWHWIENVCCLCGHW